MKKLISLVLALALVLACCSVAFATDGTISITPPTGVDATASNSYPIYKVFDAIYSDAGISYSVMSGKSGVPDVATQIGSGYDATRDNHFIVDGQGNVHYGTQAADGTITDAATNAGLSTAAIKAIAAYIAGDDPVATATSTGSAVAEASVPLDGYYYISTTTGTAVTITSMRPHGDVNDKNSVPTPHKIISSIEDNAGDIDDAGKKALAQVGKKVYYTVTFDIENGAKGYKFHDTMTAGLSYNNDVAVGVGTTSSVASSATTWQTETVEGETITLNFADAYVADHVGETVTVTYSATVTSDALQRTSGTNTVKITYGNNSSYNSTTDHTDVYNAKITIKKTDGTNPLEGAGFILKNAYNQYFIQGTNSISWGAEADATVMTSTRATDAESGEKTGDAVAIFAGLPNGTYTLIEKVVPPGYNKAPDQTITIKDVDADDLELEVETTVVNNSGTELPSTGGIGTTIFYIVGGLLLVGAAIVLISRRKAND